jgi:EAL domain-containing protein (putative c-di-GMP-specific phosphodiesterase class I)
VTLSPTDGTEGVRLLSHRPSVLFKIEHHATEPADGDIAVEGVVISGPGWGDRLRDALAALSHAERACLFAVRLDDDQGLPLPAKTLLDRARTDWFPKFLSQGQMTPVFQPIVDLNDASVHGREALMRGKLGKGDVRGAELQEAAEAHDALYLFDLRARAAAIETGLPALPDGELLYVNIEPRAVIDVESSLRSIWPLVGRLGADPKRIGLELTQPERYPDPELLKSLVAAHREQGATIALDNLSAGGDSLTVVELVQPDLAKLDRTLCKGIESSPARRRLVGALVEVAHELSCKVVAVGIERDSELEAICELGVDYGQGFFLGQPTEEMLPVDARLVKRREVV